jgi:hypothetical protein
MDVRLPDGTVIKNVPEGTTKRQLLDKLKAKGYDVGAMAAPSAPAPPAPEPETFGQQVLRGAASTADIVAESVPGMAAMVAYPFQRVAGLVTGQSAEDVAASQARVLGAVSAPIGRMTGVSETPSYQNNLAKQALGFVAENMDKGADWISGQTGLPKPDVMNMMQVVMSAAPVKVPGAKTAGTAARAAVQKGRDIIDPKTAFYTDLAEGRGSALLAAARAPEAEIIPGVRPTFAQATADVGLPRVAAVGEQAAKKLPTEALALKDVQEAGRVSQLRAIERTPEARARAERVREARSEPLYTAAEMAGDVVDTTPVLDLIDGTIRKNPGNQPLLVEMRRIRKGLVKPGVDEEGNPILVPRTNAKEVASTIDGLKSAIAKEDNKFIKGELTQIKDDLTAAIPSMKEAQAAFKKGSKPINQMDVGKYLREKLEAPVPEGGQRASVFAGAVREAPRTIKQALKGGPTYEKLTDILSKEQKANVDRVLMDLSRDQRVKELAQMGREAAPDLAMPAGKAERLNLLNRLATIANVIIDRLEGKINEKLAVEIASEFLDADKAAAALETAMRRSAQRAPAPRRPSGPISRAVKRAPVVTAPNQMNNRENRNAMSR